MISPIVEKRDVKSEKKNISITVKSNIKYEPNEIIEKEHKKNAIAPWKVLLSFQTINIYGDLILDPIEDASGSEKVKIAKLKMMNSL